jgi:hypothetical protein
LGDYVVMVNRRQQQHRDGEEEPEPCSRSRRQPHGKVQPSREGKVGTDPFTKPTVTTSRLKAG